MVVSRQGNTTRAAFEAFGGGGHKAAAGGFINEPFDVAQTKVLDAVRKAMR